MAHRFGAGTANSGLLVHDVHTTPTSQLHTSMPRKGEWHSNYEGFNLHLKFLKYFSSFSDRTAIIYNHHRHKSG